jgi:hypothetical protein
LRIIAATGRFALPREAAVMSAQKQQIHLDPGSIGGLNEDDPLRRDLPDVVDRQPPGQHVEAVEDQADMLMVGVPHRLPGPGGSR